ncbi:hypothetical protein OIU84_005233 [Salix udensis]|uniref:NmrA-like domain-containing protein n=1 Tax=Salix udensis TaxID=889485 RepID=A0AAD6JVK9_9ROSI|nr:hypothetical protein OIU84_005233 [Salix udensis]
MADKKQDLERQAPGPATPLSLWLKFGVPLRLQGSPTLVPSSCSAAYYVPKLEQSEVSAPPGDKITILGDGNGEAAVFNKEDDIGTSTIKAVDGPRTLNKTVLIKPPQNIYSFQ